MMYICASLPWAIAVFPFFCRSMEISSVNFTHLLDRTTDPLARIEPAALRCGALTN